MNGVDQIVREPWVGWAIGGHRRRVLAHRMAAAAYHRRPADEAVPAHADRGGRRHRPVARSVPAVLVPAGRRHHRDALHGLHADRRDATDRATEFLLIMSVSFALAPARGSARRLTGVEVDGRGRRGDLTQNVAKVAVLALGLLVALNNLGIALTPILTALGVGSLAVALALQPALSNFFAGLRISRCGAADPRRRWHDRAGHRATWPRCRTSAGGRR